MSARAHRGALRGHRRADFALTLRAAAWTLGAVIAFCVTAAVSHAGFVIVNLDGAGEGFNDPTPVAQVGGNPGTTVGQQRLNVFVKAGQIWDAILQSPITISVQATFDPLSCSANSGVLGSAGPNAVEPAISAKRTVTTLRIISGTRSPLGQRRSAGRTELQLGRVLRSACRTDRTF